ncbi:MAG: tetratricopeptide repeat protein [Sphingobacteriaceae bacterium]|nr:tetratricopeptide repeat protein [Sphingobacteriaceae bacterium]
MKSFIRLRTLVFLLSSCIMMHSQTRTLDSLKNLLSQNINDTTKLNVYISLCDEWGMVLPDSIQPALQKAMRIINSKPKTLNKIENYTYEKAYAALLNAKGFCFDQLGETDSAYHYYNKSFDLFKKLKLQNEVAYTLVNIGNLSRDKGDFVLALEKYNEGLKYAEESQNKKSISYCLNNIGLVHHYRGELHEALTYYQKALKLREEVGYLPDISQSYNNVGAIYKNQGIIEKALEYYNKALKIDEKVKNIESMAGTINNIAMIYYGQGDGNNAIDYMQKALKYFELLHDERGISLIYSNLGHVHMSLMKFDKAMYYFKKCLNQRNALQDKRGVASSYSNIGTLFSKINQTDSAYFYHYKSLELRRLMQDQRGVAESQNLLAKILLEQNKLLIASRYCDSSLNISIIIQDPNSLKDAYSIQYRIDSAFGNYKEAFSSFKKFITFRDSLKNDSHRKAGIKNQLKYDFEKKEMLLVEQNLKEKAIAEEKQRSQQYIIMGVSAILVLVLVFAVYIFKILGITRKQKDIIQTHQNEILDSIHYARRIQMAQIPSEKQIATYLKKSNKK